jgi:hypothetical protein
MTLFLLWILFVGREFNDVVDSIRQLSLIIKWRFQGLQGLCFRWRFMDQPWHNIFDNSMHQPWIYFCYGFYASIVNSMTLSIPYGSCHSVLNDDLTVYSDSVFANNLWICIDIAFLTIPCVSHDSIFAINLMRGSWSHWRCRFHTPAVTQYSLTILRSSMTLFSLKIYRCTVT